MNTNERNLFKYLSPQEQKLFKTIQKRVNKNYSMIPALYRVKSLTSSGIKLKTQVENDKAALRTLKAKAEMRRAKEISLSQKINNEKYEELKRKFVSH